MFFSVCRFEEPPGGADSGGSKLILRQEAKFEILAIFKYCEFLLELEREATA